MFLSQRFENCEGRRHTFKIYVQYIKCARNSEQCSCDHHSREFLAGIVMAFLLKYMNEDKNTAKLQSRAECYGIVDGTYTWLLVMELNLENIDEWEQFQLLLNKLYSITDILVLRTLSGLTNVSHLSSRECVH